MEGCDFLDEISSSEEDAGASDEEGEIHTDEEGRRSNEEEEEEEEDIEEMEKYSDPVKMREKRKRGGDEEDAFREKRSKKRKKEENDEIYERIQRPPTNYDSVKDIEITFNDGCDSKDFDEGERDAPMSFDKFLLGVKEKHVKNDDAVQIELGALDIISRMNRSDRDDEEIVQLAFDVPEE